MDLNRTFERVRMLLRDRLAPSGSAWVPIARVEGEESQYPAAERITADMLRAVAENYDFKQRAAPIIYATEDAPIHGRAHAVGEYNAPAGWTEETYFDGLTLWGKVRDVGGKLVSLIEKGLDRVSVGIFGSLPEVGGQPYLRHVALIGSQPPGTTNLGFLSEHAMGKLAFRDDNGVEFTSRTFQWTEEKEAAMADDPKNPVEDLLRSMQQSITEQTEKIVGRLDQFERDLSAQKEASEAAKKAAEAALAAATGQASENLTRELQGAVDTLVREGFVPPAERDVEVSILRDLASDKRAERIETLRKRPAFKFGDQDPKKVAVAQALATTPVLRDLVGGGGIRPVNTTVLDLTSQLMAEAGGDLSKFRDLAYKRAAEVEKTFNQ